MKKIKIKNLFKINLKTIITIIITSLLVGGTTAFATYNYLAKDIEYNKSDGTKISVENALNELYSRNNILQPDKIIRSIDGMTITENYSIAILFVGRGGSSNYITYNGKKIEPLDFYWYSYGEVSNMVASFKNLRANDVIYYISLGTLLAWY